MLEDKWEQSEYRSEQISEHGIIGLRHKIFVEVQSSIWYGHMPAKTIKALIGDEIWDSYYKFCSIRNPFTKMVSLYHWHNKTYFKRKNFKLEKLTTDLINYLDGSFLKKNFEVFLDNLPMPLDSNKYKINDDCCLDDFIRFEFIEEDMKRICNKLNIDYSNNSIPFFKKGKPKKKISDYYSTASKQFVAKAFEWEINNFNYEFPE